MATMEDALNKWREKIERTTIADVRAEAARLNARVHGDDYYASSAVIAEYEEKQANKRHSEQMEELVRGRESQDTGNRIQTHIRTVLIVFPIATIIVTIAIAWFNRSP